MFTLYDLVAAIEKGERMGEKGNVASLVDATGGLSGSSETLIERTTTTATTAVTNAGQDLADTIREKAIGAVADNVVAEARERLDDEEPGLPPAT